MTSTLVLLLCSLFIVLSFCRYIIWTSHYSSILRIIIWTVTWLISDRKLSLTAEKDLIDENKNQAESPESWRFGERPISWSLHCYTGCNMCGCRGTQYTGIGCSGDSRYAQSWQIECGNDQWQRQSGSIPMQLCSCVRILRRSNVVIGTCDGSSADHLVAAWKHSDDRSVRRRLDQNIGAFCRTLTSTRP